MSRSLIRQYQFVNHHLSYTKRLLIRVRTRYLLCLYRVRTRYNNYIADIHAKRRLFEDISPKSNRLIITQQFKSFLENGTSIVAHRMLYFAIEIIYINKNIPCGAKILAEKRFFHWRR
jgi:hypothetical protein